MHVIYTQITMERYRFFREGSEHKNEDWRKFLCANIIIQVYMVLIYRSNCDTSESTFCTSLRMKETGSDVMCKIWSPPLIAPNASKQSSCFAGLSSAYVILPNLCQFDSLVANILAQTLLKVWIMVV